MPLVTATDDDAFVAEISKEMEEQCRRGRESSAAMIEEYLRRRLQASEEAKRNEMAEHEARFEASAAQMRSDKDALAQKLEKAGQQLNRAAKALGDANDRLLAQRCLGTWTRLPCQRKQDQQKAAQLAKQNDERQLHHCYLLWRLFSAARHQRRQANADAKKLQYQLEELSGQIDVFKARLIEEKRQNEEMDKRLKDAFVRGVSALNREAVQALRGAPAETDVTAIEDILSKHGGSRRNSNVSPPAEHDVSNSNLGLHPSPSDAGYSTDEASRQGICPVHHVDGNRNYYHRCYAPATCDLGSAGAARRAPFVVHGNVQTVPSYTAGVMTRSAPAKAKPSRFRF